MKQLPCILCLAGLAAVGAQAQVTGSATGPVTITSADMFNQVGLYFKAYSNPFDPTTLSPTPYPTGGVQGSAGPNQFWDFSKGPTNVMYQFDYVSPTNSDAAAVGADFPDAKIVEKKTDLASGDTQWLFFDQVPGVGRKVYGFYADNPLFDPSNVFTPPIIDFPDQITFGQQWTTATTYVNNVNGNDTTDPTDPTSGGTFSIAEQVTLTSTFTVDAWGTVNLPAELGGFGQALRVNESDTIDIGVDDGSGNFQHAETDYAKTFYWLMPGRGMVAALASTQTTTPTDDNFATGTQFWRMFATNKKPSSSGGGTNTNSGAVTNLTIKINGSQVLLTWDKASGVNQYELQYSTAQSNPLTWQSLGVLTNKTFQLDTTSQDRQRLYRVKSIQ